MCGICHPAHRADDSRSWKERAVGSLKDHPKIDETRVETQAAHRARAGPQPRDQQRPIHVEDSRWFGRVWVETGVAGFVTIAMCVLESLSETFESARWTSCPKSKSRSGNPKSQAIKDQNLFSKGGSSDPRVLFKISGTELAVRSSTKKKSHTLSRRQKQKTTRLFQKLTLAACCESCESCECYSCCRERCS